jgi:hypothetical protein
MKKISSILAATVLLTTGSMVSASDTGGFGAGIKAGTLGAGVEVTYAISPRLTMGVGINKFTTSTTDTTDGIDYDVDLDLKTIAVLANFHPFAGSFRFTAGVMINSNELSMKADPAATYDIGGVTYTAADVGNLSATVDFKRTAPYVGIGFGHSASSGIGFNLDIGVLMQGEPNVDFKSTGGILSNDAGFLAELATEEANAEDDISGFTLYPVVSAGLNFRF